MAHLEVLAPGDVAVRGGDGAPAELIVGGRLIPAGTACMIAAGTLAELIVTYAQAGGDAAAKVGAQLIEVAALAGRLRD